jgi:hypothetical protein
MAREFATRSGQVGPLDPVAFKDMSHPPLRPKKNRQ